MQIKQSHTSIHFTYAESVGIVDKERKEKVIPNHFANNFEIESNVHWKHSAIPEKSQLLWEG